MSASDEMAAVYQIGSRVNDVEYEAPRFFCHEETESWHRERLQQQQERKQPMGFAMNYHQPFTASTHAFEVLNLPAWAHCPSMTSGASNASLSPTETNHFAAQAFQQMPPHAMAPGYFWDEAAAFPSQAAPLWLDQHEDSQYSGNTGPSGPMISTEEQQRGEIRPQGPWLAQPDFLPQGQAPKPAIEVSSQSTSQSKNPNKARANKPTPAASALTPATGAITTTANNGPPKKKYRVKNRAAAKRCRDKSRQNEIDLVAREKEVTDRHRQLEACAAALRNEIVSLKQQILQHGDCNCVMIQSYIASVANEIDGGGDAQGPPRRGSGNIVSSVQAELF